MKETISHDNGGQKARSKWCRLDLHMIPSKLSYYFNDGIVGSIDPYFNLFFLSIGLTYAQAGWISGISFAISAISGPLFGSLADKTGKRRIIFIFLCIGTACSVFPLPFVPKFIDTYNRNRCNLSNVLLNITDAVDCKSKSDLTTSKILFNTMLVLTIVARFFFMALPSYIEGIVMNVVNNRGTAYGSQKVFSCIGYSCFNFIAGVVNSRITIPGFSKYAPGYFVFLFCVVSLLPTGIVLVGQSKWDNLKREENGEEASTVEKKRKSKEMFIKILSVCSKPDTIIFFITIFMSGLALNILQGFSFVLIKDYMHGTTIGMTVLVQVVVASEIIFYSISSKLIKFLGGPFPAMILSLFSYFPRYMLMSYCTNQWIAIAINSIHGFGLGIHWVSQMTYTYKIFPKELKMTGINIVCTLHSVVCGAIANAIGGTIYNSIGGLWLLRGTGVLCGVWAVILAIYYKSIRQKVSDIKTNENRYSTATIVDFV